VGGDEGLERTLCPIRELPWSFLLSLCGGHCTYTANSLTRLIPSPIIPYARHQLSFGSSTSFVSQLWQGRSFRSLLHQFILHNLQPTDAPLIPRLELRNLFHSDYLAEFSGTPIAVLSAGKIFRRLVTPLDPGLASSASPAGNGPTTSVSAGSAVR
jgi:hypothetical protein